MGLNYLYGQANRKSELIAFLRAAEDRGVTLFDTAEIRGAISHALGVTFSEMVTGTLPFMASDPKELVHCHLASQPRRHRDARARARNVRRNTLPNLKHSAMPNPSGRER